MAKLEECVRSIQADGLVWGSCEFNLLFLTLASAQFPTVSILRFFSIFFSAKLVPVGYGIKKLQIQCVVEDDKVGTDMLEEQITAFDEYVQFMDVAAFNKI